MSYGFFGFNNYYMGCCRPLFGGNPCIYMNSFYNPLFMINTAKYLTSSRWLDIFSSPSPYFETSYTRRIPPRRPEREYSILPKVETPFTYKPQYDYNLGRNLSSDKTFAHKHSYNCNITASPYLNSKNITAGKFQPFSTPAKYTKLSANHLDAKFLAKVKDIAKNINCDYEDLLAVMNSESGINPGKWNRSHTAVGLIQFTDSATAELKRVYDINITKEEIAKLSAIEQLDLAEKFYLASKAYHFKKSDKLSAADLYALTYLPSRSRSDVLCRKGERNKNGQLLRYYESNKAFDKNNDGVITKSELNAHLALKKVNLSTFA